MTGPWPRVRRAGPEEDWTAVLDLLHAAFAPMEGRIDPPSSLARLSAADIATRARTGAVFLAEDRNRAIGCLFAEALPDALYCSKIAVASGHRGRGLARALLAAAEQEARNRGLPALTLSSRVELTETHAAFRALGFAETGRSAHPGFDRPTSVAFRRPLEPRR
ncbi:MAG: GNAT family N-acetyltransferase [Paracoccaceae bacterium]